jgi:hypothetical protein
MNKRALFKQMLEQAKKERFYIGTGNPEARILIIGKEAAIDNVEGKGKTQHIREFENNISDFERDGEKYQADIENWNGSNYSPLYPYKGQLFRIDRNQNGGTSRTWYNYQKLYKLIFEKAENQKIDFHEGVFITEVNSSPSKLTHKADTSSVQSRKAFIKDSAFFQGFPVVIVAGLGYFEISNDQNEIEDIFGVKFHEPKFAGGNTNQPYWIHYSEGKTKLLINTRQLSMNVSDALLQEIAEVVRKFISKTFEE